MITVRVTDIDIINAAKELPGAPRLLVELGALISDPNTDASDITNLLKQDPSLAARLIRMANSAAYGRGEPVSSIDGAVSCVGFREVHRLVGALAAGQLAEKPLEHYGISPDRLRRVSLFTAVLMDELAKYAGESERRCYTIGLLRSMGIMALQIVARHHHQPIPAFNPAAGQPLGEWEKAHWGLDNCEASEVILSEWLLPDEVIKPIRHHYRPAGQNSPLAHLLALASSAAQQRYEGLPGEESYWSHTDEDFREACVEQADFKAACERAEVTFKRLESALA